jgi:hypothetical protein
VADHTGATNIHYPNSDIVGSDIAGWDDLGGGGLVSSDLDPYALASDVADHTTSTTIHSPPALNVRSITVVNPTAAEDLCIFYTPVAITVTHVYAVIAGTSCTINPTHGTDRSSATNAILDGATAITNTTTGQDLTSFNDATIPAASWVVLKTTAATSCTALHVTLSFTVD